MTIFKIIGRCSSHLAFVKVYLRDLSLIGRVSNCHLEGSQFESGRSRFIKLIKWHNKIYNSLIKKKII